MANLVSIDWSIEEFRRLISEQPKSSEAGSSIEKTVDVLNCGLASPSETIDRVPPIENASSREAEAASERSGPDQVFTQSQVFTQKKDRSVDSTVADVMALTASRVAGSDKPIASPEADRVRDIALDILNPEVSQPSSMRDRRPSNAKNAAASEVRTTTPVPGTEDKGTASVVPLKSDVQEAAEVAPPMIAPSVFAEARKVELRSPLQKAVVEPDIHTSRADRERAVALRWVLRDINGNRLKWSPPREEDLKILIEFDLVEMKNGLPQLTVAGLGAIEPARGS